jgi:hypothetical protein
MRTIMTGFFVKREATDIVKQNADYYMEDLGEIFARIVTRKSESRVF